MHGAHGARYDRRVTLRDLVADLVRIDSVNPELVPGGAGEAEIARFVAGWLERAGVEVRCEEVAPGRWNAIGIARGRGGGRTLLLDGHTDTSATPAPSTRSSPASRATASTVAADST
jgi:acetylornithine deacetylase